MQSSIYFKVKSGPRQQTFGQHTVAAQHVEYKVPPESQNVNIVVHVEQKGVLGGWKLFYFSIRRAKAASG